MRISCAALPWLSGRKTVSACQREVSLVLSISSGEDKKTDGTGEVRGPCYGWQVCLFGLSLISRFSLPRPSPTLPIAWPGSDHAEMDQGHFSAESQHYPPHSSLRPTQSTWGKCGLITLFWLEKKLSNLYFYSKCAEVIYSRGTTNMAKSRYAHETIMMEPDKKMLTW